MTGLHAGGAGSGVIAVLPVGVAAHAVLAGRLLARDAVRA